MGRALPWAPKAPPGHPAGGRVSPRVSNNHELGVHMRLVTVDLDEVVSGDVRTRMYLTSADHAGAVSDVHRSLFGQVRPAATTAIVAGLLDPRWHVEVEAEAVVAAVVEPPGPTYPED